MGNVRVRIESGDIGRLGADVVALRYQGALSGATGRVANALAIGEEEMRRLLPDIGSFHLAAGGGRIRARQAAFLRVVPIGAYTHDRVRQFPIDVLRALRERAPDTRHLGLTVHGVMFGTDLDRSLRAQLEGCAAGIRDGDAPLALERITVVNRDPDSVREFQRVVDEVLPDGVVAAPVRVRPTAPPTGAAPSLFDIFISFKSEDAASAQQVYEFLAARGLRVFFSRESLPRLGSDEYHAQIDLAIEHTRHMVVVTSAAAHVASQWVQYEWRLFLGERLAGRKSGNLVTVIAGDMTIDELPIGLRHREVLRATSADLTRLVEYTRADVDGSDGGTVRPPPPAPAPAGSPAPVVVAGLQVNADRALVNISWTEANTQAAELAVGGERGWRLPTLEELQRLRARGVLSRRGCYWSTEQSAAGEAFYMHCDDGHVGSGPKAFSNGLSAVFVKPISPEP